MRSNVASIFVTSYSIEKFTHWKKFDNFSGNNAVLRSNFRSAGTKTIITWICVDNRESRGSSLVSASNITLLIKSVHGEDLKLGKLLKQEIFKQENIKKNTLVLFSKGNRSCCL